jgi:drug/metabolite transporter (DMT)-like permease
MSLRRRGALLGVVLLMVVWGSTFVVTKAAVREVPPFTLAAVRFIIAVLVLAPFAMTRGGLGRLPQPLPWRVLLLMALTGIVILTVGFNFALQYGSASQGSLIYALTPGAIALGAVIALRERVSRRRTAGIVLSIAGVAWLIVSGESQAESPAPLAGAACMLAGVIAWVVYTVAAKRLAAADQIVVITVVSVLGALMLLPFAAVELLQSPRSMPSLQASLGIAYLGVLASAAAYLVYNLALRELDASLVGVLSNLDPIVGVVTSVVFLDESLNAGQMGGGSLALIGMWLASSPR